MIGKPTFRLGTSALFLHFALCLLSFDLSVMELGLGPQ